jgi:DnaK suppressor protein
MTSKVFIKKIKENLLNEKKELLSRTAADLNLDLDVDLDGDETDEIQGKMLIELQNTLNTRTAAKVFAIESALKRIEDKSYGYCEDCGEEIPEKRLLANPHFQSCVGCAEDKETEERQRRRA